VKLLGREAEFLAQYGTHNAQSARVAQHQAALMHIPRLALEILAVGGLAALVFAMVAQGRGMASIAPTLGLFAAAAFRLMPSVNRILNSLNGIRYCAPAVGTVHEELKLKAGMPPVERRHAAEGLRFKSEIRMTGLAYSYPGAATPALSGIEMTVRKGEAVGFVGASGAGKSTLVDVLLGLFAPGAGMVLVDGRNIAGDLRAWQDQIGYVPQSIYLTDDTVRRNVAFGLANDEIDDAAVERALRAAQLHDFVASLPQGVETMVGEKGVRLSGGQRQRIGIARALYHDPGVLVLDEATSALDTATERGVMQAVAALHGSKTIVIVAHRLSTVEQCDRLYQLERGRVVAEGTPAELLRIPRAV
jgi:ABC-type multidrug transport system fused ATPase/permease subunit